MPQRVNDLLTLALRPFFGSALAQSPFLVSKPAWLVGDADEKIPPSPPWAERKGIFFAGHIPKPYIRDTRYTLWRQLRNDARATVLSPTLFCTVGGFAACRHSEEFLQAQNTTFYTSFCRAACRSKMSLSGARMVEANCLATGRTDASYLPVLKDDLRNKCNKGYLGVNFADELGDMRRDTRRLPHPEYLRLAMSHRFCLVAPGDFVSTHKVSEAMALGGAGGCIPVFVLPAIQGKPGDQIVDVEHYLPFTRWLDWCSVAYFVSEYHARRNMRDVLSLLDAKPMAELEAKRARLREVRDAFTFRRDSSMLRPSAAEYILGDVCQAVRLMAMPQRKWDEQAGGNHSSCVLVSPGTPTVSPRRIATPTGGVVADGYQFTPAEGWLERGSSERRGTRAKGKL